MSPGGFHRVCCCPRGDFESLISGSEYTTSLQFLAYRSAGTFAYEVEPWSSYYDANSPVYPMSLQSNGKPAYIRPYVFYNGISAPWVILLRRRESSAWAGYMPAVQHGANQWAWVSYNLADMVTNANGDLVMLVDGYDSYEFSPTSKYTILKVISYAAGSPGVCVVTPTVLTTSTAYALAIKADTDEAWSLWASGSDLKVGPSVAAAETISSEAGHGATGYAIASNSSGTLMVLCGGSTLHLYERTGASSWTQHSLPGSNADYVSLSIGSDDAKHVCYKTSGVYHYARAEDGEWTWDDVEVFTDSSGNYGHSTIVPRSDGKMEIFLSPRGSSNHYARALLGGISGSWTSEGVIGDSGHGFNPNRLWARIGYSYPTP